MTGLPQRKSPRLRDYDYAREGAYFVTICVQRRLHLFGAVEDGVMCLNDAGNMVGNWWASLPGKFPQVNLDLFVIMPNHLHGIVVLTAPDRSVSLSQVMQWFKIMTTNAYIRAVHNHDWTPFERKLWQRSYHDHIIRDERGLNTLRGYIQTNPTRWHDDTFYS